MRSFVDIIAFPTEEEKVKMFKASFYLQFAVLFIYAFAARTFFYFERSNSLLFAMLGLAGCLELLIRMIRKENLYFPLSAMISALGCAIIIDATNSAVYLLAVFLAIISKFAFRDEEGKHYFNPSNFAVVILLLLYPGNINVSAAVFGGSLKISATFFLFGVIITILARQFFTSLFWIIAFGVFAFVRADFSLDLFVQEMKVLSSASMLLFTFNMITDPKTSPQSIKGRFCYSFIIAGIDALARAFYVPYGNFCALFVISALMPIIHAKNKNS